ncbi:MAG: alanine:cation symporter family protein, partial [Bacteroidales bacterium]|nr:alanine:cation symporter family protein [Bacteroidales bacterium]
MLEKIISEVNAIVWNPALVVLLIAAGLYFSFRTRMVQVRRFGLMLRSLFSRGKDGKGISSFEAFCIALSGRVGTGNIVGVATAIAFGGPGAVFWMWVVAFFGASTAFVESTLAQIFKFSHSSGYRGGPFSFIEHGLKARWLGIAFAVITLLACGVFLPTVQANGVSSAMGNSFPVPPLVSGIALAVLLGLVVFGGVKRIAKVASVITPFMAFGYIILSLVVVGFHISDVPAVLKAIVTNAFGINPVCGGILGSTIAMGVKRGIFSNEAGQGTGAIVSAATDVPHPAQQGLAQAFSVYVDTLLVCTATALMILTSGTYNILDVSGQLLYSGAPELANNYVGYTQNAVDSVFKG